MIVTPRCFPPPWTVDETHACFTVRDANGQALAYVYFEDESGRRAPAKLLSHDEARRIAHQHRHAALPATGWRAGVSAGD